MKLTKASFVLALITVFFVVADVEAGWKFWKKKENEETTTTTTLAPEILREESAKVTPIPVGSPTTARPNTSPINTGSAIIGASNPGLAVGVGSNGDDIRNRARPSRPNPGTEVGLDISQPKPARPGTGGNTGQGYRDWIADLTRVGEPRQQPPRLPVDGPALNGGGSIGSRPTSLSSGTSQPQAPGSRPLSVPGSTPVAQPQPSGGRPALDLSGPGNAPVSRPQSPGSRPPTPTTNPSGLALNSGQPSSNQPGAGGNQVSTLNVGTLKPTSTTTPSPVSRPGSPVSPGNSGLPGRTWADVAGGGSRPNSPTPSPRQPAPGQAQPRPQTPTRPGQSRPSTGAIAAGGALAGAAAVGAATAGTTTYSSNPTYSKGNGITDEDLEKLAEALFIKDKNNANRYITMNLQKQTSSGSTADEAPQPLFTVNSEAFQIPSVQRVLAIYDNYHSETNVNEHISPLQREEESLLVDTFLSTNVMSAAMRFLADKGHIRKDYYEYKDTLRKLWFNLFSRGQGKVGSSGFEHVFMVEVKQDTAPASTSVIGLHNWIYYSKEEVNGRADYNGYLKKIDLGNKASIIKIRTKYSGFDKPVTTLFVGTSPELEMALYTVCFFARPEASCPVSLGGTKFNIVTHKFKYRGNDLVGTAYPDI